MNAGCVGAFCYYHRSCLDDVGLFDDTYLNAFEHVDHSYMLAKKGYSTPYWWWADVANSYDYLDELSCSEDTSIIRQRDDWQYNINKSAEYFISKHGYSPAWQNSVPDLSISEVVTILKRIKNENQPTSSKSRKNKS